MHDVDRTEFSARIPPSNRFRPREKETHLSPFCSLPCRTDRWYSIEDSSRFPDADFRSVTLSWFAARWVFVDRSARGALVVESIVKIGF